MEKNPNNRVVNARRVRLRKWIDDHFRNTAAFIAEHKLNQGEISGLLKDKSFGEKRARALEVKAGMPYGYLDALDGAPAIRLEHAPNRAYKFKELAELVALMEGTDDMGRAIALAVAAAALKTYSATKPTKPTQKKRQPQTAEV